MYAHKPFTNRQVCIKELVKGYEISIAFDDSCNALSNVLNRGDIRVYAYPDDRDVTNEISTITIPATIDNLIFVYNWCNSH